MKLSLLVQVINTNPNIAKNQWTDVTQVEKFEISDAEYEKRTGQAKFKRRRLIQGQILFVLFFNVINLENTQTESRIVSRKRSQGITRIILIQSGLVIDVKLTAK